MPLFYKHPISQVVCYLNLALLLSGCAMTPQEIRTTSNFWLCDTYSAPAHPNFLDPAIKAELERRGAASCTDPTYVQLKLQGLSVGAGAGLRLLEAGRARPLTNSPPPPTTTRCRTLIGGNVECTTY